MNYITKPAGPGPIARGSEWRAWIAEGMAWAGRQALKERYRAISSKLGDALTDREWSDRRTIGRVAGAAGQSASNAVGPGTGWRPSKHYEAIPGGASVMVRLGAAWLAGVVDAVGGTVRVDNGPPVWLHACDAVWLRDETDKPRTGSAVEFLPQATHQEKLGTVGEAAQDYVPGASRKIEAATKPKTVRATTEVPADLPFAAAWSMLVTQGRRITRVAWAHKHPLEVVTVVERTEKPGGARMVTNDIPHAPEVWTPNAADLWAQDWAVLP